MINKERPSQKSIEVAARVWCDQEMTSVVMDKNAAMEIARIVDNVLLKQNVSTELLDKRFVEN